MTLSGSRIAPFGDSITFDSISPQEGAWRHYFGEPFSAWFGSNVVWVGENNANGTSSWAGTKMVGASGQRVDNINSTYDPGGQISRGQPDLGVIHLGTNDCTQSVSGSWVGGSVELSITNLSTLITTIFTNATSSFLLCVCKIIHKVADNDTAITSWNSQMATMVASHTYASRIFTADCNTAFKNNVNWQTDYMQDNTHPNSAGKAVLGAAILSAVQANVTLGVRTPVWRRRATGKHTGALRYSASTATTLGSGTTLDSTQPWAVYFDIDLSRASPSSNQGILALKTDQATPFVFLTVPSNQRYFEFGSSANFNRFFPANAMNPNMESFLEKGWHGVEVIFDGVSRTAVSSYKLVVDGDLWVLLNGSGLSSTTNVNEIGRVVAGGVAGTFDMANLTIWNGGTAKTVAQARDWYFDRKMPSGVTLTREYRHGDLSGTTLTDSTGNQNGTIGTASWITSNLPTVARSAIGSTRTAASTRSPAT